MPETRDSSYRPGNIDVKNCLIYNYKKSVLDVRHLMLEFSVYHDLFTGGAECDIVIADSNGLVEMMPIVGDETIVLSFKTPTLKKHLTYVFRVTSVNAKAKATNRSEVYVIHGVAQEVVNNSRRSVNRSFVDLKADKIIRSIYNNYLKPTEEDFGIIRTGQVLDLQETDSTHALMFTGEGPMEAIQRVCLEAMALDQESRASSFLFYQREDGWYLRTIDSLLTQDPVDDFFRAEASVETRKSDGEKVHEYQMISELEPVSQFDTLRNLESGLYVNEVDVVDPLLKRRVTQRFDYEKDRVRISHIDSGGLYADDSLFSRLTDSPQSMFMISNVGDNYSRLPYLSSARDRDPQIRNPRIRHRHVRYDIAGRAQIGNIVLNASIPGNTDLHVGEVVNIHVPQSTQNEDFMNRINLLHNKKFLVTALRHTYNKEINNFFTVMEVSKDSYGRKPKEI